MDSISEPSLRAIRNKMDAARLPGCTFAVARRDGACWAGAIGFADVRDSRAATVNTTFHLFSGTKLYTAAAVTLLSDRGLLDLDAPAAEYVPGVTLEHPVTIRQLCSHSSGLRDTLRAFLSAHRTGEPTPSAADALHRYQLRGSKAPGGKAAYRNVNYALLGEIVTRVSGRPYESFVQEELLTPLSATLSFAYDEPTTADTATGYIDRWSPMRGLIRLVVPGMLNRLEDHRIASRVALCNFSIDTAAIGGLIGSAPEFLPLLREFLSPEDGVLTADAKRAMLTLHAEGGAGVASKVGVGLGWKLGDVGGVEFWNHEGGGPGFVSETRLYPAAGLGMVVLSNTMQTSKRSWAAHEICEILRRECGVDDAW